jgi:hypothetical protein
MAEGLMAGCVSVPVQRVDEVFVYTGTGLLRFPARATDAKMAFQFLQLFQGLGQWIWRGRSCFSCWFF